MMKTPNCSNAEGSFFGGELGNFKRERAASKGAILGGCGNFNARISGGTQNAIRRRKNVWQNEKMYVPAIVGNKIPIFSQWLQMGYCNAILLDYNSTKIKKLFRYTVTERLKSLGISA